MLIEPNQGGLKVLWNEENTVICITKMPLVKNKNNYSIFFFIEGYD